jgi:hypothetical protein
MLNIQLKRNLKKALTSKSFGFASRPFTVHQRDLLHDARELGIQVFFFSRTFLFKKLSIIGEEVGILIF